MALTDPNIYSRGATALPHLEAGFPILLNSAVDGARLIQVRTDNKGEVSTAGSTTVVGVNGSEFSVAAGTYATANQGPSRCIADDTIVAGKPLKSGDSGRVLQLVDTALSGTEIDAVAAGGNFGNQPANDGIEVVSASAADTTQTLTLYGTTNGADTVVVETITLNGTTQVDTVKVDWGVLLGAELSAVTAGNVTIREASGNATITTITAGGLSSGVQSVPAADQQAYNVAPTAVAGGASTKQIGLAGTNSAGTTIYDSQALNGTTAVTMNSVFKRVTKVFFGDLATATTATINVGAAEAESKRIGKSVTAASAQNSALYALVYP